jgi:murein DD-endopeptidase MepM/ murein hydrolase activator NlpD
MWSYNFHPVVPFDPVRDRLYPFDFTEGNTDLDAEDIADTERFAAYINRTLRAHGARYGFGGYGEHRTLYARSRHFDTDKESGEEPRRLHLGIDIWGPAGTKVMAPLDAIVHSFAFNNNDSDYGATLILTHPLEGIGFHTLYGHLSLNSLKNLEPGKRIIRGEVIAEFGMRFENGNWPPHLHFQLIRDMQGWKGDYPGVCRFSEQAQWLANCPDPDRILGLRRYSLPIGT